MKAETHLRRMARAAGLVVLDIQHNTHYKVHVQAPDGRKGMIVCGVSPSDYRAMLNQRSRFRKFAKDRPI